MVRSIFMEGRHFGNAGGGCDNYGRQVASISIFSVDLLVLDLGRPEFCMICEVFCGYSNVISR